MPASYELERDACGIGFVADGRGRASRSIVDSTLEALCRVRHRGAVAADELTGDGAGVLLPIPRALVAKADEDEARLGIAMCFFDPEGVEDGRAAIAQACTDQGLELLRWRAVPVEPAALGDAARAAQPVIEQAIVQRPEGADEAEGERRAFRARRAAEGSARGLGSSLYVSSFSFRTTTYKALCAADQLGTFYPDLVDARYSAWFGIFHQRYSTNTTPSWQRAQPFRLLAHNGEINTIRGNVALMRAREGHLGASDIAGEELLRPVIDTSTSDSGVLDQVLELLVRGGRDPRHAMAMMLP
ncbi:MAG: glutamate synthase subunit alpha, partial [Actinomycetota bacterium]|nr:glutamate synthase subunit alpha [Actinomycetota bacterium]